MVQQFILKQKKALQQVHQVFNHGVKMNKVFFIVLLIFLSSCKKGEYFLSDDKRLMHSTAEFEDYATANIKALYYPQIEANYYTEWIIYKDREKKSILAQSVWKNQLLEVINYWENGGVKELKRFKKDRKLVYWIQKCENGNTVIEKRQDLKSDTIRYCNGNISFAYDRSTGKVIYGEEDGTVSVSGKYVEDFTKDGLWTIWDYEEKKHTYEIYNFGKMIFKGDSIPEWYHK